MATTIASPVPLRFGQPQQLSKNIHSSEPGRETPLPQYEKTQSVPFTLNLQEDAQNPGQFQLVVNVGSKQQIPNGVPLNLAPPPLNPAARDGLKSGLDNQTLYQTQKSSPPTSPLQDKGWSDLDHVPSEFLQKVVPDWNVSFSRSDSTASTQSKRLTDIKARIKKKGKGYVVRLLKGSSAESDEIAEVELGQQQIAGQPSGSHELDSAAMPAELYSPPSAVRTSDDSVLGRPDVYEIGTSNEEGVQRPQQSMTPRPFLTSSPSMRHLARDSWAMTSIAEDGFSDAETLIPDVRSVHGRTIGIDDEQTDLEPFSRNTSMFPTRSASVSSIVKTPTRGLSLVGPVRRIEKKNRPRAKSRTASMELKRSDAHKSIKRRSGATTSSSLKPTAQALVESSNLRERIRPISRKSTECNPTPYENNTWQHPIRQNSVANPRHSRTTSVDDLQVLPDLRTRLRLQTNVPQSKSAATSPAVRRRRSPRTHKPASLSPSSNDEDNSDVRRSPEWEEVDHSDKLREALGKALASLAPRIEEVENNRVERSVPRIVEPVDSNRVGDVLLPLDIEIRSAPTSVRNPTLMYWGLALSALSDKAYESFKLLRDTFGTEPPVPQGHVRVRWTCSCGDSLYDDFIEQRPNAARLLEAYLNRPRAHTPRSPTSQSSTSSSISSIFDSSSRASTLATPSSTYGGPSSWTRTNDPSKYSPSRIRTNNPFSVRMPTIASESWLLTCANEGRLTPKIVHLDVNEGRVRSDMDLAQALREHYNQVNGRWFSWARLRGLTTVEFVQFEVHRNRFADIRAAPSMPPKSSSSSASTTSSVLEKETAAPSSHPYTFEPNDLLPPVGSTYLLHLFRHPNDYDGELITYLRAPKRRQRLEFGMGWGVHLVEGFLAQRVWGVVMGIFGLGSVVFAVLWTIKKDDVQGAFGVAQWVLGVAVLLVGGLQAWIE